MLVLLLCTSTGAADRLLVSLSRLSLSERKVPAWPRSSSRVASPRRLRPCSIKRAIALRLWPRLLLSS